MDEIPLTVANLLALGRNLGCLRNIEGLSFDHVSRIVQETHFQMRSLALFKHYVPHDMVLMETFQCVQEEAKKSDNWTPDSRVLSVGADSVYRAARALDDVLTSEGFDQRICILFEVPSERLNDLESSLTTESQKMLYAEMLGCLERQLPRSAIVMCWSLTFDFVRTWIHSDPQRLKSFNTEATRRKNRAVQDYEDFFELGERLILDVARASGLLPKDKFQNLVGALDKRNKYAHPSFEQATINIAAAYAEDLAINIIQSDYFQQ